MTYIGAFLRCEPLNRALPRYLLIGVLNTLFGMTVIVGLHAGVGLNLTAANAIGYGLGLSLSYVLNRTWTFRHAGSAGKSVLLFAATVAFAFAINLAIITGLMAGGASYLVAQAMGVISYSAIVFWGLKYAVFANQS